MLQLSFLTSSLKRRAIMIGSTVNRMIETAVVRNRRCRLHSGGLNSLLVGLFNNGH